MITLYILSFHKGYHALVTITHIANINKKLTFAMRVHWTTLDQFIPDQILIDVLPLNGHQSLKPVEHTVLPNALYRHGLYSLTSHPFVA